MANAALLVSGEGDEGTPVVVVRGLGVNEGRDQGGAAAFVRPPATDLFATPDREYD